MPESVRDRPTKSHEQVFLLARSRRYFYDPDAVREPFSDRSTPRPWNGNLTPYGEEVGKAAGLGGGSRGDPDLGRNMRSVWSVPTQPYPEAHFAPFPEELPRRCILAGCPPGGTVLDPFLGSETTAKVARDLGRDAIGIELNPGYARLAEERNGQLTIYEGMALSS
jgi:DNA modification methylase